MYFIYVLSLLRQKDSKMWIADSIMVQACFPTFNGICIIQAVGICRKKHKLHQSLLLSYLELSGITTMTLSKPHIRLLNSIDNKS